MEGPWKRDAAACRERGQARHPAFSYPGERGVGERSFFWHIPGDFALVRLVRKVHGVVFRAEWREGASGASPWTEFGVVTLYLLNVRCAERPHGYVMCDP